MPINAQASAICGNFGACSGRIFSSRTAAVSGRCLCGDAHHAFIQARFSAAPPWRLAFRCLGDAPAFGKTGQMVGGILHGPEGRSLPPAWIRERRKGVMPRTKTAAPALRGGGGGRGRGAGRGPAGDPVAIRPRPGPGQAGRRAGRRRKCCRRRCPACRARSAGRCPRRAAPRRSSTTSPSG